MIAHTDQLDATDLRTILEWDVPTWAPVLTFWAQSLGGATLPKPPEVLECGARNGGVSYFFAKHLHCKVHCSDLGGPTAAAKDLHHELISNGQIVHHDADARELSWPPATFDCVVVKSVLGGVRSVAGEQGAKLAMAEMYRVLRPGGLFLFAENLAGSWLHQQARARFVPWGTRWQYFALSELDRLLQPFTDRTIMTTGFSAAFAPTRLKAVAAAVDRRLLWWIADRYRYVGYGVAMK